MPRGVDRHGAAGGSGDPWATHEDEVGAGIMTAGQIVEFDHNCESVRYVIGLFEN